MAESRQESLQTQRQTEPGQVEPAERREGERRAPQRVESRRPARLLDEMQRDVERMFESFVSAWPAGWRPDRFALRAPLEGRVPRVNVIDREDEVLVTAELPGVDKDDIEVSVGDGSITIRASTRAEDREESGEYYRREISTGEMIRTVAVPDAVDEGKCQAKFQNGLLRITLPKTERAKRKRISIQ